MNLYVWEGVLTDYTDGIMFAMANSVDEARDIILRKYHAETHARDMTPPPYKNPPNFRGRVWEDLQKTPKVYHCDRKEPVGFIVWGGS